MGIHPFILFFFFGLDVVPVLCELTLIQNANIMFNIYVCPYEMSTTVDQILAELYTVAPVLDKIIHSINVDLQTNLLI